MSGRLSVAGLTLLMLSVFSLNADALTLKMIAASAQNMAQPHDIVLSPDHKHLYVADNNNNRIVVLDAVSLKELSVFGENELSAPHDVVFDNAGRLLVADTGNHRIAIYALDNLHGKLVGALEGGVRKPEGVAAHADGRVFATGAGSGNLVVYRDGKVIAERRGFSSPHDVEFDPTGAVWVADANNDRMVRLNAALETTMELSGPDYRFKGPRYMDFDTSGRIFIADKYSNQVKIVTPDGTLVKVLGTSKAGKGEGLFNRPEGVEIHGNDVWFSDTYNNRIVRYRITD